MRTRNSQQEKSKIKKTILFKTQNIVHTFYQVHQMIPKGTVLFGSIFLKLPFLEKLLSKNRFHIPENATKQTVPFGIISQLAEYSA